MGSHDELRGAVSVESRTGDSNRNSVNNEEDFRAGFEYSTLTNHVNILLYSGVDDVGCNY